MKGVAFEEKYTSDLFNETTYYFTAPKSLLGDSYPEAESAEIQITLPEGSRDMEEAEVMLSPTRDDEDYDWNPYSISREDFDWLMEQAEGMVPE